jgi:hypothetical protein
MQIPAQAHLKLPENARLDRAVGPCWLTWSLAFAVAVNVALRRSLRSLFTQQQYSKVAPSGRGSVECQAVIGSFPRQVGKPAPSAPVCIVRVPSSLARCNFESTVRRPFTAGDTGRVGWNRALLARGRNALPTGRSETSRSRTRAARDGSVERSGITVGDRCSYFKPTGNCGADRSTASDDRPSGLQATTCLACWSECKSSNGEVKPRPQNRTMPQ